MKKNYRNILAVFIVFFSLCSQFAVADDSTQTHDNEEGLLKVIFFSAASCDECLEVKLSLPDLLVDFEGVISLEKYDIETEAENLEKYLLFQEKYSIGDVAPPVIFIGNVSLLGKDQILSQLQEEIIEQMESEPTTFPEPEPIAQAQGEQEQSLIMQKFSKFSVGAVTVAGLLDGINPCAFTTIVFFISMLSYLGKSQYQLVVVGIGFTSAVFLTYLLLGLGLLGAVKSIVVGQGISMLVTRIVAVLTFILAGWSFVDYVKYMKTKSVKSMTLGLPKSIKTKIHKVIRVGIGTRGLLVGSISVGVLVALLESICTGQVYLPIIIYVAKSANLTAIAYLALYNVMFILPLVFVLIITYHGVKSESLGNFFGRHIGLSKIMMTLLFLGLGIILLLT